MNKSSLNAAVLWSGGKDCSLAHFMAVRAGYEVQYLVTFAPPDARFCAHPISLMHIQAEAMGLYHLIIEVSEPYADSYKNGIQLLSERHGISTLVTGDIAEVDGCPNWIRQCCEDTNVSVYTPLWDMSRDTILTELIGNKFKIVFSCIKEPHMSPDWLGRELNIATLQELQTLSQKNEMDSCGENGEYHTVTLDSPLFKKEVVLASYRPISQASMHYLDINRIELLDK